MQIGKSYKIYLSSNIPKWVTPENNYFMHGDLFNFEENTESVDTYVTHIRQIATLFGHGEPKILEVFKNAFPTTLYWILFPIEDLKQVVEIAKNIN